MVTITISGEVGSGKTTVGKKLSEKTGYEYVYSGMIFRKLAEEHDKTLAEFGEYCEKNEKIDKQLDEYQLNILKNKDDIIVEGRLAGWLAFKNKINSLKIFLTADLEERTRRVIKREKGDIEKRKKKIISREKSEQNRYKKYYDIDIKDRSIYDLVIDTTDKTSDEIVDLIYKKIKE
ncbi:MAG: AAA family ATPase [Candidatus Thermoplasmatota archaeon]